MNIIIALPSFEIGGAERQTALFIENLIQRRHEVTVVTFKEKTEVEVDIEDTGATILRLPIKGPLSLAIATLKFLMLIRQKKIGFIYSILPFANIFVGLLGLFSSQTRIIWGIRSSFLPMKLYGVRQRLLYFLELKLMGLADGIITNSYAGRKKIPARWDRKIKTSTIPNAIDTSIYFPSKKARQSLRKKYKFDDDILIIGIVARLDPVKDHCTFITAARIFIQKNSKCHFFIVGHGDETYKNKIIELIETAGLSSRITLTGWSRDVSAMLNMFDIANLLSLSEGFPNSLGEAMATETPCVATDVGDCRTLLGDAGIIVPIRDAEAVAYAWESLSSKSNRRKLGILGRERVKEKFAVNTMVDETIKFIESC